MSGTSLDGVDGVLVAIDGDDRAAPNILAHARAGFDSELRAELFALNRSTDDEIHRGALAANALARCYGTVVESLLTRGGIEREGVAAIGCHGQTVRHRPGEFDGTGYTVQLNAPALLAELTGIDVVADFRGRDVAAGGQGAPLVPAFHRRAFGRDGHTVAVLNLGGIANVSVLGADGAITGFDCGPGNALLDLWCTQATGHAYDADGAWAASGRVDEALLGALLDDPYFSRPPPKSTGRDGFHAEWLETRLHATDARRRLLGRDIQATLAELTARTCADACRRQATAMLEVIVCGGGAFNADLLDRLGRALQPTPVVASGDRGLAPDQVEACAFAWLASAFLDRRPGSVAAVTGAAGPRVLGALYPAG